MQPKPKRMSEKDLRRYLREMKDDSEEAFRSFYNLTYDRLFRIAYYYVKKESLAQEVVIDAFMNLWNKRSTLSDIENLENYLFTVTKNVALNTLEKESHHQALSVEDTTFDEVSFSDSPEEVLISEELFARYVKALDRLPERCRQVFIAIREERKSYKQVASEMNITEKTVDAQLQKALQLLREALT